MLTRGPKLVPEAEVQKTPFFARFARWVERQVGRSSTFVLAIAVVLLWAVSGPVFRWSDTWQLVINTGTTIVTFLMVFVIQNTQSRDTQAMQLKLDELIRVNKENRAAAGIGERSVYAGTFYLWRQSPSLPLFALP
jgi:low affinity Fe/Cu permease